MTALFESFCQMLEQLPPKGVFQAAQIESRMIEEDLIRKRTIPIDEAVSIVSFSKFLKAMSVNGEISPGYLSIRHIPPCRQVVERLVAAGELPQEAKEQFDLAFSADYLKALAS